jgi:hypothetical protein
MADSGRSFMGCPRLPRIVREIKWQAGGPISLRTITLAELAGKSATALGPGTIHYLTRGDIANEFRQCDGIAGPGNAFGCYQCGSRGE